MKKTKIICSIGPSSSKYEVFKEMVENGMNVARINFSHATESEIKNVLNLVQKANKELGNNIAVLYDTKGPDFRTGKVENDEIKLKEGKTIRIVKEEVLGNEERITVNYKDALDMININDIILLEDGLMKLLVVDKDSKGLTCSIIVGGLLGNKKGVNVPGVNLNVPFISKQDELDIRYACKNGGDFLALSFVSDKEDIIRVKEILKSENSNMQIISKIESNTAIKNIDEIIEESDGIMVARGDLGVEVPMKELPILQKKIIKKCRERGKFVIVATEMLASMYKNARPTRAEVTDIANAVLDGTDAVMLSGETTTGKYPVDAVKYMAEIALNTEEYLNYEKTIKTTVEVDVTDTIARSVVDVSNMLDVKTIIAATISGNTAIKISNLRPKTIVIAACPTEKVAHSLSLRFGVYPVLVPVYESTDELINHCIEASLKIINYNKDDLVVITGGFPNNVPIKTTNFLKVERM